MAWQVVPSISTGCTGSKVSTPEVNFASLCTLILTILSHRWHMGNYVINRKTGEKTFEGSYRRDRYVKRYADQNVAMSIYVRLGTAGHDLHRPNDHLT